MPEAERHGAAFAGDGRIAVVAGGGSLPVAVVRTLQQLKANPLVVLLSGEAEDDPAYAACDNFVLQLEEIGGLLPRLKKSGVTKLVLAGSVERRPRLRAIRWTLPALRLVWRMAPSLLRGDDSLLRSLIRAVETEGVEVVGAHEIVPDLLAPAGNLTRARPGAADLRDIEAGAEAALAIGRLDIGQGAVAIGGRVIALEGIEGTDGLLARTRDLRGHGRIAGKTRGALVKCCKPQQERRADLPAIGPDTVSAAHEAGLAGVAVDAGRSFILDFKETIERADALGLYIVGRQSDSGDER